MVGVIWFEDEEGTRISEEATAFGRSIGNMLALRLAATQSDTLMEAQERYNKSLERTSIVTQSSSDSGPSSGKRRPSGGEGYRPREDMRTAIIADSRSDIFRQHLASNKHNGGTLGAEIYDDASVLVITLTDSIALAEQPKDTDAANVADHLVRTLQDLANEHEIDYVKIMGNQLVCATGLGDEAADAYLIGDIALRVQQEYTRLFTELDKRMVFRLGIDTGPVIGSRLGGGQKTFNLWGQAIHAAILMAQTGESGRIQVTESTYRRLREHYVFRVRGRYYLETVGELSTYILAGRMT